LRLAAIVVVHCLPRFAEAQPLELRSRAVEPGSVIVDGDPGEWRGIRAKRLGACGERQGPWNGTDDASVRFAIAHDADRIYVAARVSDDDLQAGRDAVTLYVGFSGGRVHAIEASPGDGRRAATVKVDGHAARGGEAVEMATDVGWNIEASIPWEAMPEARRDRTDLRAAFVLEDADAGQGGVLRISSASGDARRHANLAPLWLSDQEATLQAFLAEQGLRGKWPTFEASGNVAGDDLRERFLVVDTFLVVFGPGYRGGNGYFYTALPVASPNDVREARLVDLTGDGRDDVVLRYVERGGGGRRTVLAVHSFRGEDLVRVFAVETRKEVSGRFVESEVEIRGHGADTRIEVRPGRARGFDAQNLREASSADMEPVLLPWGPIARRVYRFDGTRFARESEETREVEAPAQRPQERAQERPAEPPSLVPPGEAEVFARFLADTGMEGTRPTFDRRANVAGDAREERVAVVGKRLVVLGPGFAGGTSFFFMELPVAEPAHVLALDLRDATGDGRADLVWRIRQNADNWGRDVVSVAAFEGEALRPLLAQEVALFSGENRVDAELRFVRGGVEVVAGDAHGWTQASFPQRPVDVRVRSIPVPWGERRIRLRLRDGGFVSE